MPGVWALEPFEIEAVFREHYGRAVAVLVGAFGDAAERAFLQRRRRALDEAR